MSERDEGDHGYESMVAYQERIRREVEEKEEENKKGGVIV